MKLVLKRIAKLPTYTIGKLYIDGLYICDTLEDTDRNLTQHMSLTEIQSKKVYGKTAIPTGTYSINMSIISPKFKSREWAKPYSGKLPRLINVPGFDGILIHVGNSELDSLGCILVGFNKVKGKVVNSTEAFHQVMCRLKGQNNITITIE